MVFAQVRAIWFRSCIYKIHLGYPKTGSDLRRLQDVLIFLNVLVEAFWYDHLTNVNTRSERFGMIKSIPWVALIKPPEGGFFKPRSGEEDQKHSITLRSPHLSNNCRQTPRLTCTYSVNRSGNPCAARIPKWTVPGQCFAVLTIGPPSRSTSGRPDHSHPGHGSERVKNSVSFAR